MQRNQRNVNGNMDSAEYQNDIIYDIEMHVNALCSYRRDIFLCMISRYAITLKLLEYSQTVKEYLFWNDQRIRRT